MDDAARAHGAKRLASQLCMALARRRRKSRAAHVAESDAGAIESRSILDERQAARTAEHIARRPLPFVTALLARLIQRFPGVAEPRVQAQKIFTRRIDFTGADGRNANGLRDTHGALRNR